jgi:membrane protein
VAVGRWGGLTCAREFFRLLWKKFGEDDALFIAGAIAWGVLFALVPLIALGIGLTGFVLSARFEDSSSAVLALFTRVLPEGQAGAEMAELLEQLVGEVMVSRTGLTVAGSVIFLWFASRLSGSLRSALYTVFEVGVKRGVVVGKLFDLVAVAIGVVLVTVNMGVTVLVTTAVELGVRVLGWGGPTLSVTQRLLGAAIAFASIWTLFVIVYRYLPLRRTPWKTTLVAATFAALAHEALKLGFSWYATEIANYTSPLGNLATIVVLLLWIYYGALVFILGGEVAYVWALLESRRSEAT